jgi:hypothetical protein
MKMKNLLTMNRVLNPFAKSFITFLVILTMTLTAFSKQGITNAPPVVSIKNPIMGATYESSASITFEVTATDADGSISKVEFYANDLLIETVTSSPYTITWTNMQGGLNYALTAVATDNGGASTTSEVVNIIVTGGGAPVNINPISGILSDSTLEVSISLVDTLSHGSNPKNGLPINNHGSGGVYGANIPPTISIIDPIFPMSYISPATVNIEAAASDVDGTVTKVDFYANSTLIGSSSASPYTLSWANMAAGTYSITAVATDNGGLTTTSASVGVTIVGGAYTSIFKFISFSGTITYPQVNLAWSTSNATNSAYFQIQRSSDNITFNDIDTVFYQSLSGDTLNYTYKDISPLLGNNYYRIRRVSTNGTDISFTTAILINNPGGIPGFIWIGRTSTSWSNGANWSGGVVPNSPTVTVTIPAPTNNSYQPTISAGVTITVKNLIITKDAVLTNNGTLRIAGKLNNKGKLISSNGAIAFVGNAPQTVPQNAFDGHIKSFTVDNPSGLKIEGDVPVGQQPHLYVSLFFNDPYLGRKNADGTVALYDSMYCSCLDGNDAIQMANMGEDIAFSRSGKLMSIETRPLIVSSDTLFIYMQHMRQQSYEWQFNPTNWGTALSFTSMTAELVDSYTGTRTPIDLGNPNVVVSFTITSAPSSYATNRFYIVFNPTSPLPVVLKSIRGYQHNTGINVDWEVNSQVNMDRYEIERARNGNTNFLTVGTVDATTNMDIASYTWFDAAPYPGVNYYRIKMINKDGKFTYSSVVKVMITMSPASISVYPNPVAGSTTTLQLTNLEKGTYRIMLMNNLGQVVYNKQLTHDGGSATQTLEFDKRVAPGVYQLSVSGDSGRITTQILKK